MKLLGNIVWILFGGFFICCEYMAAGILSCLTIVGIPFGVQLFKLGLLALLPFGQEISEKNCSSAMGCVNVLFNIVWIFTGGLVISLTHLLFGLFFLITIVGIPFGLQHLKLMRLAFTPFGKTIS